MAPISTLQPCTIGPLSLRRSRLAPLIGVSRRLPVSPADRRAIALRLGCSDTLFSRAEDVLADDLREHMAEARRIFDARFYEMRG
jgi:hypothetical protein